MANPVPLSVKVSPKPSTFALEADFNIVRKLMKESALYQIPEHARKNIIAQAQNVLEDLTATSREKMSAAKFLLECDKINLDVIKLVMPKKVEHIKVQERSTEELIDMVSKAIETHPELKGALHAQETKEKTED